MVKRMKHSEYWESRMLLIEEAQHRKDEQYFLNLDKQYKKLSAEIEREISRWYVRFANNNKISLTEAKRLLNTKELKEFRWDVYEYIKFGKENALDPIWMKELENASSKVHISRLEALKLQIQQHIEVLYGNQLDEVDSYLRDVYKEGYYQTLYEIQKGLNVGWEVQAINKKLLDKVIANPWANDGKVFSDRLWTHKKQLIGKLQDYLTQSAIMGKKPDKVIKEIAKYYIGIDDKPRAALYAARRLVMTESAAFASDAQKEVYADLDVEAYKILATLDKHTSEICRKLDGKVVNIEDYKVGATAPPFHACCRTVTVPHFDDEFESGKRAARGADGKVYYVSADLTYKEWFDQYVKGHDE